MARKLGLACVIVGAVLLLGAAALLGHNFLENRSAGESVARIRTDLAQESGASRAEAPERSQEREDGQETEEDTGESGMDTVWVDGFAYIGTLTIPTLGLELPIMSQWSYEGMKVAPGRYAGSPETGDLILCGHNYQSHFGTLKQLSPGDAVTFRDVSGREYDYQVQQVLVLQPTEIQEMISGDWDLTLFTCTTGGKARVTVRCDRVE